MSITEMQACLARLYIDDSFRNLFYLGHEKVLDGYVLTEDERRAIQSVDRERLTFFASSLKSKRRKGIRLAYPALFKLEGDIIDRCYDRYYQLYPAKPDISRQAEILQFGQFMEETLAGFDALPPYVQDLARYECRIASMNLFREAGGDDGNSPEERPKILPGNKLVIREGMDVADFAYDVAAIYEALLNDQEPLEITPGVYSILFQCSSLNRARFFSISSATKAFLDLCDGNTPLIDIVDTIQTRYSNDSLANSILALANQMLELGVIEVKFHEEHCSISR